LDELPPILRVNSRLIGQKPACDFVRQSPLGRKGAAMVTPAKRQPAAALPPAQRSAVTNGRLFAAVIRDGRSGWSRRMQDVLSLHISDLGGEDIVSSAERSIIRRIATISTELEWIEQQFAASSTGPSAEQLDVYLRGSNSLRRLLESIGLKRVPREVESLSQYLQRAHQSPQQDQDDDIIDVEAGT
jgi:hypothetical protein